MAKQDVLDAINATIAPNNIKGITAESLNNVLTMMAENAGEGGSGDGALRVIVPELIAFGGEIVGAGELSPSSWAAMRPELEASLGLDLSEYEEVVNASFAHNANVAQQILAKAKAGQGVSVVLDHTLYLPTAIDLLFQIDPGMAALYGDFAACVVQPAALSMQYVNLTPDAEEASGLSEQLMCSLNPLAPPTLPEYSMLYPSNMDIVLNLDGSLTFTPIEEEQSSSGSGVVTFYMLGGGAVQNDTTKAMNKASYDAFWAYNGLPAVNILSVVGESATKNDGFEAMYPIVVAGEPNGDLILQTNAYVFVISSDGNIALSNSPTA